MFAIINIAGQQFKVSPGERVFVPKLSVPIGSTIKFDRVLLKSDDKSIQVGDPYVKDTKVEAKVLSNLKDEKVIVFKKKRRKGYRVRRGHRQQFTELEIINIE